MSRKRPAFPGLGRRPIAIAVLTDETRLAADARRAARLGAGAIEVRADFFSRARLRPDPLRQLLAALRRATSLPVLLTLRARAEGGHLPHGFPEQDRLLLIRAALSEVSVVDVELSADDINRHVVMEAHKRGRAVVLSYHNFKDVPPDARLRRLADKARRLRADVLKVAAKARSRPALARLVDFCRRSPLRARIVLPMGRLGRAGRLEGFRWGSCASYGYVRRPVAPGQPSVKDLVAAQKNLRSPA